MQILEISQYPFSLVGLHAYHLLKVSQRFNNILLSSQRLTAKQKSLIQWVCQRNGGCDYAICLPQEKMLLFIWTDQ